MISYKSYIICNTFFSAILYQMKSVTNVNNINSITQCPVAVIWFTLGANKYNALGTNENTQETERGGGFIAVRIE